MTGSAMVTWTATDDCGTDTCSATFMIADETAPTVTGPEDSTVECDGGGNQADLDRWLAGAGADDTCGAASLSSDFAGLSDDCGATGSATVTWTATDDCANTGTHTAAFSIEDTTAPTITLNGPAEMTLECHVDVYAEPGAVAADSCDTSLVSAQVRGDTVDVNTPGTYLVTYDAVDGCGNEAEQVTRTVEVVDTLPPAVTNGEMIEIWPPNHHYRTFSLSDCAVNLTDLCEGELEVDALGPIMSIYSDEPEDANGNGDGRTANDIVILGSSDFKLRAERQGGGNGRVYGVTFEVSDAAGHTAEATCYIGVPHDQSGDPPIDNGAGAGYSEP
ncbi:MAG: immunoglobulin-like domain-containing protein [Planctomycetota bacterium]